MFRHCWNINDGLNAPVKSTNAGERQRKLMGRLNPSNNVKKCCLGRHFAGFCDTASIFTKVIAGKAQIISIARQRGAIESNGQTVP